MNQRQFWKARVKQAPGAKRRATIAALIEQHRARTGEVLAAPDIAKLLAISPARVAMHLEALAQEERRKVGNSSGGSNVSDRSKNIRVQSPQLSLPRGRR